MNPNLEPLEFSSEQPTVLMSDVECIRILADESLLDKMVPNPPNNICATRFERSGCWCLAIRFTGFSAQSENGFSIYALPQGLVSKDEADQFFLETMLEANGGKPIQEIPFVINEHMN